MKLWDSQRREIERAIESGLNPAGMSIRDGKAHIDANILRRMLQIIDDKPDGEHTQGTTYIALLKQEVLDNYKGWESVRRSIMVVGESPLHKLAENIQNMHMIMLMHEKSMAELVSKVLKK